MNFPRITLANLNSMVAEHGCLAVSEREESLRLANEIVFEANVLMAKIAAWADEIRRMGDGNTSSL
jgi:hypothetical protein